ncbi:hypothetical protein ACIBF7_00110 [Nonomuraea sp. NPDC050478]|uniref:hypothetical protein n=1 Tax=Nonomuraea sp. NPDC050478 TaxID=3364365 RepID=UPI0037BBDFD3
MRKALACVALVSLASCGHGDDQLVVRSLTAMERVARATGPDDAVRPRKVGEVGFQAVFRKDDRVYFQVGEHGPGVDPYGYVWSPDRAPVDDSNPSVASSFKHLRGHWYRWRDSY